MEPACFFKMLHAMRLHLFYQSRVQVRPPKSSTESLRFRWTVMPKACVGFWHYRRILSTVGRGVSAYVGPIQTLHSISAKENRIFLSISMYLSLYLAVYLSIYPSIYIYLSISIYLSIYLHLSMYVSIYLRPFLSKGVTGRSSCGGGRLPSLLILLHYSRA